jgi:hypothetical protein
MKSRSRMFSIRPLASLEPYYGRKDNMFKNKSIRLIIIAFLCVSVAGCAGLQRKFTRKKKQKDEKILPIINMYDYSKELRVDELYKKHYLFWRSSQTELAGRMDDNYKKRGACYDLLVSNLAEMRDYLDDSKAAELEVFLERIMAIDTDIKKKRLSEIEKYRLKQLLESTRRNIEKKFSYSDVKERLLLREEQ